MPTKRMLLIILVAGVVVLAVGDGSAPGVIKSALALSATQVPAPTSGTLPYPGRLSDEAGQPVADGAYDFAFVLYPTETGGEALWSEVQEGVAVRNGAFSVSLGSVQPLAVDPWTESSLWLSVGVRGPGESTYTALAPRQQLVAAASVAAAPMADQACPHDHVGENWAATADSHGLNISTQSGDGLWAWSASGIGVHGASSSTGYLMPGITAGVFGHSGGGHGVYGQTFGDWGYRSGVYGTTTKDHANGVTGWNAGAGPGVYAFSQAGPALYAKNVDPDWEGTYAAEIYSENGNGLYAEAASGWKAGFFQGHVAIAGNLSKTSGGFKIDHPLDPANQYLNHSFVESPDMKNVYDGVVILDAEGRTWVDLPAWFETLNQDYRYQLTPIGAPGPNLYIANEIEDSHFQIAGGEPGMKVSWQVTGIRHDPFAQANRIPVEEDKPPDEQGSYLHPDAYGLPETQSVGYQRQHGGQ